jgi:hypothetical protein
MIPISKVDMATDRMFFEISNPFDVAFGLFYSVNMPIKSPIYTIDRGYKIPVMIPHKIPINILNLSLLSA